MVRQVTHLSNKDKIAKSRDLMQRNYFVILKIFVILILWWPIILDIKKKLVWFQKTPAHIIIQDFLYANP